MANQIFDIDRFGLYFRKYVTENRRMLGIYALELLLIPAAVLCFSIWLSDPYSRINVLMRYGSDFFSGFDLVWGTERSLFTTLFGLFAAIGASLFYNVLSKKKSRIVLFNTPASNLEKSVTYFLIYIIGVILLFFAGSILADYVRIPLCRYLAPEGTFIKLSSSGCRWEACRPDMQLQPPSSGSYGLTSFSAASSFSSARCGRINPS